MAAIARQGGPDELFMLVASVPELRTELQGELAALPEYWLGVWTKSFGSKSADRAMRDVK